MRGRILLVHVAGGEDEVLVLGAATSRPPARARWSGRASRTSSSRPGRSAPSGDSRACGAPRYRRRAALGSTRESERVFVSDQMVTSASSCSISSRLDRRDVDELLVRAVLEQHLAEPASPTFVYGSAPAASAAR